MTGLQSVRLGWIQSFLRERFMTAAETLADGSSPVEGSLSATLTFAASFLAPLRGADPHAGGERKRGAHRAQSVPPVQYSPRSGPLVSARRGRRGAIGRGSRASGIRYRSESALHVALPAPAYIIKTGAGVP